MKLLQWGRGMARARGTGAGAGQAPRAVGQGEGRGQKLRHAGRTATTFATRRWNRQEAAEARTGDTAWLICS